ncbi:peptide chain release factor N(5)-glutamine methyltransferase [Planococcus chinensis]|uniref:Release factor glutamine methyltransferase n=1 Tax=Planococcus chinensis TaxID=272917 RepID=A0ABW4QEA0_9BACL
MTEVKRVFEALNRASSFLKDHGREENAARILLQHQLGMSQAAFLASLRDEMAPETFEAFWRNIEEHAAGVPIQHLTGIEEFYGRTFSVNRDVLIPRPETEELIEETLQLAAKYFPDQKPSIADIGTGSGVIAITMKCEMPGAAVTATDISAQALETAKANAARFGADIDFKLGDLAEPLQDRKWDIVLSNPPYIAHREADSLSDTVRDFEPHQALFAEKDGLALYEKMARQLPDILNKPGIIGFEIGHEQGKAVETLLREAFPQAKVYVKKDINRNDRMVFCINE